MMTPERPEWVVYFRSPDPRDEVQPIWLRAPAALPPASDDEVTEWQGPPFLADAASAAAWLARWYPEATFAGARMLP